MRFVCVVLVVLVGCVESESLQCASGIVCQVGHRCDDANTRCISPEQIAKCDGVSDGEECDLGGTPGECVSAVCEPRFCGDGIVGAGEDCEGSEIAGATCDSLGFYGETAGLGCGTDCRFDTRGCVGACGDDIRNGGELCDADDLGAATCLDAGYYQPAGLACSPFCTFDVTSCQQKCGDTVKNGPELCDYMAATAPTELCTEIGYDVGYVGCNTSCGFDLVGCGRIGWRFAGAVLGAEWYGMHASSATNIWIVGDGLPVHFDGTQWTETPTTLFANERREVYSVEPNLAWMVDSDGELFAYSGTAWSHMATAPAGVTGVWARAANDVWITTTANNVQRWNGTTWSAVGTLNQPNLTEIDGSAIDNVWVTTAAGVGHRWNGTTWIPQTIATASSPVLSDLYVRSATEAYAVGFGFAGIAKGLISRWNGTSWTTELLDIDNDLRSISGSGPKDLWVAGAAPLHFDGSIWLRVPDASLGNAEFQLYSPGTGDTIGVQGAVTRRHEGLVYAENNPPVGLGPRSVWGANDELFVPDYSSGDVGHFDGKTWIEQVASSDVVFAVWGSAPDAVWGVGNTGKPTFFNGTSWTPTTIANTTPMYAVWGASPTDVWASGNNGVTIHFDGINWTHRNIPSFSGLFITELMGTGPNDVWAVSAQGTLYHWTGSWASVALPPGTSVAVQGLHMRAPNEPVLFRGTRMYHRVGTNWIEETFPPALFPPNFVVANGPDDVFAANTQELFHYDGARWSTVKMPDDLDPNMDVRGLAVSNKRVDIVLANGTAGAVRSLLRIRPWRCETTEANRCVDAVDNDCDGAIDEQDADCP